MNALLDSVFFDVLLLGDEDQGVITTDVMKEDWNLHGFFVQVAEAHHRVRARQIIVITDLIFVAWFFSLRDSIVFEWAMTKLSFHLRTGIGSLPKRT